MADFRPIARVVADSISPWGSRLTTIEVKFHRFVLSEFNTHRVFSRNSASSRAIPVHKILKRIAEENVYPITWRTEQRGMQGGDPLDPIAEAKAREVWAAARDAAVHCAEQFIKLGVHKSIVNRILEPYMSHTVIVSGTDWNGFWDQRCNPDAQPEMEAAARVMRSVYRRSEPVLVETGEWHLPFVSADEKDLYSLDIQRRISAARCARTSFLNHFGVRNIDDDVALYRRLRTATPPHWSPLEHVATPDPFCTIGNLGGWHQLRHHPVEVAL